MYEGEPDPHDQEVRQLNPVFMKLLQMGQVSPYHIARLIQLVGVDDQPMPHSYKGELWGFTSELACYIQRGGCGHDNIWYQREECFLINNLATGRGMEASGIDYITFMDLYSAGMSGFSWKGNPYYLRHNTYVLRYMIITQMKT